MTPKARRGAGSRRAHLPQFRLRANSARAGPGAARRRGRGARGAERAGGARTPPGCLLGPGVDAAEITSWKIPLSEVTGEGPRRRRRQEAPRARGAGQPRRRLRLRAQPRGDPASPSPAPPRPRHRSSGNGGGRAGVATTTPGAAAGRADRLREGAPAGRGAAGREGQAAGARPTRSGPGPEQPTRLEPRPRRDAPARPRTMSRRRLPVTPWGAGEGGRRGRRTSAGDRRGRRASAASGRVRAARSPRLLCPSVRPSVRPAGARPRAAPTPRPPPPARAPRLRTLTPPPGARPAAADWPAPRPRPRPPPRAPPRRPGRRPAPRSAGSARGAEGASAGVGSPPPPRGRPDSGSAGWSSLGIVGSPLCGAGGGRGRRGVGSPGAGAPSHGDPAAGRPPMGDAGRDEGNPTPPVLRPCLCPHACSSGARGPRAADCPRPSTHRRAARVSQTSRLPRRLCWLRAVQRKSAPTAPRGSGPSCRGPRRSQREAHRGAGATGRCLPPGLEFGQLRSIGGRARVGPSPPARSVWGVRGPAKQRVPRFPRKRSRIVLPEMGPARPFSPTLSSSPRADRMGSVAPHSWLACAGAKATSLPLPDATVGREVSLWLASRGKGVEHDLAIQWGGAAGRLRPTSLWAQRRGIPGKVGGGGPLWMLSQDV